MDSQKIKEDMMELWEETFHDSKCYIKLVFEAYFSPANIMVRYDGDRLVAALLGVDYRFRYIDVDGSHGFLKATYLCGLATREQYRKQGIMSTLMKDAEQAAFSRGSELSFLIPADSHLRQYYQRKGYRNLSFLKSGEFTFRNSEAGADLNIYSLSDFRKRGRTEFLGSIAEWCARRENFFGEGLMLQHSLRDMLTVISENENSIFLTDSTFDPEYPILEKVEAVVFPDVSDEEHPMVRGIYLKNGIVILNSSVHDLEVPVEVRNSICRHFQKSSVAYSLPCNAAVEDVSDVKPYAMVKYLGKERKFANSDNPVFYISLMLD